MIRVLFVDDHPVVTYGLTALIEAEQDMVVVGTANNLKMARRIITTIPTDVVVTDIQLGEESGFDLLNDYPDGVPAILMLSSFDYPAYQAQAVRAGAAGFITKGAPARDLLAAIRDVAVGRPAFSAEALRAVRNLVPAPTAREMDVIREIAAGHSNDETARKLSLSPKTIESHLRRLFTRYGVFSRTELAMKARDEGWLEMHGRDSR